MAISVVSRSGEVFLTISETSQFRPYEMIFEDGTRLRIESSETEQRELERLKQDLPPTGLVKKFQFCPNGSNRYGVCDMDNTPTLPKAFDRFFEVSSVKVLGRNDWFSLRLKPDECQIFQDNTQPDIHDPSIRCGTRRYPDRTVASGTFGTTFSGIRTLPCGRKTYVGIRPVSNPRVCCDEQRSQVVLVETNELHHEHYKPIGLFMRDGRIMFGKDFTVGVCLDKSVESRVYEVREDINAFEVVFRLLQCPDLNGTLMNMTTLTLLNKHVNFESLLTFLVSPQPKWEGLIPIFHIQEPHFRNLFEVYGKRASPLCHPGPFGMPRTSPLRFSEKLTAVVNYGLQEANRPRLHHVLEWMFEMDQSLSDGFGKRPGPSAISECFLSPYSQVCFETNTVVHRDEFSFQTAFFLMNTLGCPLSKIDQLVLNVFQGCAFQLKKEFECLHPDFLEKLKALSLIGGHESIYDALWKVQTGTYSEEQGNFDWTVHDYKLQYQRSLRSVLSSYDFMFTSQMELDFSFLNREFLEKMYQDLLKSETTRLREGTANHIDLNLFKQLSRYLGHG